MLGGWLATIFFFIIQVGEFFFLKSKLSRAPNNPYVESFPEPFWKPWWPFWILEVILSSFRLRLKTRCWLWRTRTPHQNLLDRIQLKVWNLAQRLILTRLRSKVSSLGRPGVWLEDPLQKKNLIQNNFWSKKITKVEWKISDKNKCFANKSLI